ncbi:OVARIAN TUMOR DOMAIN-containing deubiquitinating enzyme 11-like isoform X2 [Hibiscus syriacus]|uniref:OVARIAN TUMOR DOMAIN-containing deubiquitinating enzyme 11-like isoform X2 n=1 Tax=Hibiscus syriacus TaxID=106335 RepID=UPI001924849D|nr:OVARIAN TUMOR DOMAIN-containing deubiquitinating enzyme 11-like isoform X2 [Hibiscus syriacus]
MSEGFGNASASSSSSLNSSFQDTEDDQAIATMLAEEEKLHNNSKLGKRLSHLDSIPFRALADQLFRNPDYHKHVRRQIVKQLKHSKKLYEGYVPMKYKSYLKKMKKSGEWGDHITLQAAADRFGAKICLVTSFRDTCYIEIMPKQASPSREVWLSFWSEVHYNSLYASGDVPTRAPRRKHWLFRGSYIYNDKLPCLYLLCVFFYLNVTFKARVCCCKTS